MIPIFEVLLLSAQSLSEIRDKSYHSSVMFQNLLQKVLPSMFGGHCFGMVRSTIVLILAILSMQTLASPLNLEVSIKGVQNGDTAEQSIEGCREKGRYCGRIDTPGTCCPGLKCTRWKIFQMIRTLSILIVGNPFSR